jgi:adrenodoxin-NADP+ reductase
MGVPGENQLKGVLSSRRVANWYNGSLDFNMTEEEFDLTRTERAAIIGNGNIALDISRILMRPADDLIPTDAPSSVVSHL